jgi:hypothetical protein
LAYFNGELRFWLGWAQEVVGDHATAQELADRRAGSWTFSSKNSRNGRLIGDIALTNPGLGDKTGFSIGRYIPRLPRPSFTRRRGDPRHPEAVQKADLFNLRSSDFQFFLPRRLKLSEGTGK